jgi:SET domain-containing protein
MLTVKTYIDKSSTSGNGVFAGEDILSGKIIWEYFPLIDITYSQEEWEELRRVVSIASFNNLENYAYKEEGKYIVCLDNAQFMNHSSLDFNISNTPDLKSMYAIRNISAGEELLCNYFEYSDDDDRHILKLKNY